MAGIDQRGAVATGSELQATFIVRLRRERGTPPGEWRGEVEHVQSARLARFADQAAVSVFVWSQPAEAERQPPAAAPATSDEKNGGT
jgi:hypothetical protein